MHIIEILSALLTPIMAIVTVYIAYQQYNLNKMATRKDLLDRRLVVFKNTMSFLSLIMQDGKPNRESTYKFLRETADSFYLFKPEIRSCLDEIYNKSRRLEYIEKKLDGQITGDEKREKLSKEQDELFVWFSAQFGIVENIFKPYLSVCE